MKVSAVGVGAACVIAAAAVWAAPPAGSASGRARPAASGSSAPRSARDAGPPETKDQREFRRKYVTDTLKHEGEITKHHIWSPEMSKVTSEHWRRAYRALRIRELAEDDKDAPTIGRADAFLKKIDTHFFALLTELTAKAPEIPKPPTVASPSENAEIKIGSPVTFALAPYTGASNYYCYIYEPGGHYWSNWDKNAKAYGTAPSCTMAADDPRWSKFQNGKAHFYARAIVPTKSANGKEYKMWSEFTKVDLTVTGGAAAPAASGSASPHPGPVASGGSR